MPASTPSNDLFEAFFDLSLTGGVVYNPVHNAAGEVIDFTFVRLNELAQRLLQLPAQVEATYLERFPAARATGAFDFHCDAFAAAEPRYFEQHYQADGYDLFLRMVARRVGQQLLVSFTDTSEQPRTVVKQTLRESLVREQAALAEAEAQRLRLQQVLLQMSANIALLTGPEHLYTFINPEYQRLFPGRPVLGRTIREVIPEIEGQGFYELMDRVYQTGEPFYTPEAEAWADFSGTGELECRYYRTSFEPIRDAQGQVAEVLNFAVDVTAQVVARQQVEQLNAELVAARAETEAERQRLHHVLTELPAHVAIHQGPEQVFTFVNRAFEQLFPARTFQGRSVRSASPELAAPGGMLDVLNQVYQTGESFSSTEMELWLDFAGTGQAKQLYFDVFCLPLRDAQGHVDGVLDFSIDVTEQVRTRQQVQTLNEELAAINEELRAGNEEYLLANTALSEVQQQLQHLNYALEARVQERTRQLATARAEAERQRGQWEHLFMRAPAAICIFDGPRWVYEFVNPGYQAMFPGRVLLGKPLVEALPEVADQPLMAILRNVYDTGQTFEGKEVLVPLARNEDGPIEDIYFDLTYMARYNGAGQIDGFITYAYDVTQQVLARREREARELELQRIFEQAPVAIFVLRGPAYRFQVVNPAMSELLGYPAAELLGRPYFEAVPELAAQGYPNLLAQVQRTGQPVTMQESPARLARHGADEMGYFTFVYQPVHDGPSQFTDIMCVALDVTAQVLARQQMLQLNEELQAANQELYHTNNQLTRTNADLDTFVYTASHDLKAPITNIEGLLHALRDCLPTSPDPDDLVPRLLGMMDGAVTRFQQTIGHLTDVSRLQYATDEPAEAVALADLVDDVRLDLAPVVQATQAQVLLDLAACPTVYFSPKNLRSIVYNLLSNALKFHDPTRPPVVQVRAHCLAGQVVLEVQDNGLGLSPTQQSDLFMLFKRLHTHVEGTGVGLYMLKRIIENASGTITVQSQLGVGSTFSVTLPGASPS
jgi:PAS domain S-box-containing protein